MSYLLSNIAIGNYGFLFKKMNTGDAIIVEALLFVSLAFDENDKLFTA